MITPVFNAMVVRRATEPRFAAASSALPTPFAEVLAAQRSAAAAARVRVGGLTTSDLAATPRTASHSGAQLGSAADTGDFPDAAAPWLRSSARRELAASIQRSALDAGVTPGVALGVAIAESSLEPGARSSDGLSEGTFQVTRATAAQIEQHFARGVVQRPSGSDDVALGLAYLRYLDDVFERGTPLGGGVRATSVEDATERQRFAVAAFNAGEGRVATAQQRAEARGLDPTSFEDVRPYLPGITQRYVDRVIGYSGATTDLQTQRT